MAAHVGKCEIAICLAPTLATLVAFRIKVGPQLLEEYLSFHNAVTSTIRGFVVNNSEILACPGWNDDDFFMLMSEDRAAETGWREILGDGNLQIVEEQRTASVEMFANCVWYTIMCRMAPEWNRVGTLFVQGCDFLADMNNRRYRAIDMKVAYLPPGRLELVLSAYIVSFRQFTRDTFNSDAAAVAVIDGQQKNLLFSQDQQAAHPAFVLPRETRGTIRKLSKSLPGVSVFENFSEVREYWKDMYGYCLPKDDPEFYCEIIFFGPSRTVFTYPSYCLLSAPMEVAKANELEWVQCIKAFTTDLYVKVPVLCGTMLKLIQKPQSVTCNFRNAPMAK